MRKSATGRQFFSFVIPSMLSMLLNGLYTIIDGFFIGQATGDAGLAGLGLAWPVTAVIIALGMGIGAGGSVLMSAYSGAGDTGKAESVRTHTFAVLGIASVLTAVILSACSPLFMTLLGAKGAVYDAAVSYIRVIAAGSSMQIVGSGLLPVIRNEGKTVQAMLVMGGGLTANIVLDAVFTMVLPWGLTGAAAATVAAPAVTVAGSVFCLRRPSLKKHPARRVRFRWDVSLVLKILKTGISPFGLSLIPSLVTVFFNWQCLAYGGDIAVSAYSVMNYFLASALLLLQGVGEGIQPLVSYFSGARAWKAMRDIRNKGFAAVLFFGAVFTAAAFPARTVLPRLFAVSEETAVIIREALPVLCSSLLFMGMGKLFVSCFYACGKTLFSTLLIYFDPVVFTPLCILLLPRLRGLEGVWMTLPAVQILTMLLLIILFFMHTMELKRAEHLSPQKQQL